MHTLRQTRIGSYPEKWGKNQARSWKPKVPRPLESWEEPGLLPARATSPQSFRGEPEGPRLGRGVECSCGKSWFRPTLTKFKTSSATAARKAPEKCSSLPDKTPPQTRKVGSVPSLTRARSWGSPLVLGRRVRLAEQATRLLSPVRLRGPRALEPLLCQERMLPAPVRQSHRPHRGLLLHGAG